MKKSIRTVAMSLALLMVAFMLVGCASGDASTEGAVSSVSNAADTASTSEGATDTTTASGETIGTIGVLFDFLEVERRVLSKQYLEQFAAEANLELIFLDANGDEEVQMQQAENLITKEVDVLVILPQNAEACGPIVADANEAGIPIISFDRLIPNADIDYYIGFDNDIIGELMAQYVFDLQPTGNYVLIQGAATDPNCEVYYNGWMRVIGAAVDSGDITIVGNANSEGWDPNNAYTNVENILTMNNDDVDVILAMNDGTAGGVIQALKERNLNGKILVTGQDGEMAACQRIIAGDQVMTVWKPDNDMAQILIDACVEIVKGGQPATTTTINNEYKDVPAILSTPVVVDKDNMQDTIIAAGYYTYEEVYEGE